RELLDLSRLEAGDVRLEIGPIELAPLCASTLELVRARAQEKKITLGFDGPPGLRALGDRRALEQILVNLLDNAVKYTPAGGRITVLTDGTGTSVVLSVLDTGPGIEPRHRARIFERFYRADLGRARSGQDADHRSGSDLPVPALFEVVQRLQQDASRGADQLPVDRLRRRDQADHGEDDRLRRLRRADEQRRDDPGAQYPAHSHGPRRGGGRLQLARRQRAAEVFARNDRRHLPGKDDQVE